MSTEGSHDKAASPDKAIGETSSAWTQNSLNNIHSDLRHGFDNVDKRLNAVDERLRKLETRAAWFAGGVVVLVAALSCIGTLLYPIVESIAQNWIHGD